MDTDYMSNTSLKATLEKNVDDFLDILLPVVRKDYLKQSSEKNSTTKELDNLKNYISSIIDNEIKSFVKTIKESKNSINTIENTRISQKAEDSSVKSQDDDEVSELELALIISGVDALENSKIAKDLKISKHHWNNFLFNLPKKFASEIVKSLKKFLNPSMARKQEKSNNNKHKNQYENQHFERNNKSENLNSIVKQNQDKHLEIALAMSTADEKEENIRMDFQESDSYRADHNFSNDLILEVERLTLMNKKYENELVIMKENNDMRIETELDNINIQKRIHHQIKVCMNDFDLKPYKEAILCIKLWRDCYNALMVPRKKLDHIFDDESDLEVNVTSLIILELCAFLKKVDEECKSSFLSHIRPHIKVISRICSELSTRYLFDSNKHIVDLTVDSLHPVFLRQFERVQIRGDGNCLWNSISFAMFGDYSKMESLRLLTAAALIQYKDYFVGHLNEQMNKFGYRHGLTYEQLIDASLELSIWGDEYHLLALSLALHRPIVSYGSFAHISNLREDMSYEEMKTEYEKEDQINHMLYVGDSDDKHKYPICIYYNGENHYCAILPRNTDVMPPIPKTQLFQTVQEFSKADTTSSLNSQRYMNSHSRADENLKRNGSRFSEKNDKKFDSKLGRSITRNEIRESKPK